jgi:metal-sulfur cluster biosynthetic enzyme
MTGDDQTREPDDTESTRAEMPAGNAVDAAWKALRFVYDPELYLDVVSLGLIYDIRETDGTLFVEMTLTTPGCPASESLSEMVRAATQQCVGNSTVVDVRVVWDPPWSPALIDKEAAEAMGFRIR